MTDLSDATAETEAERALVVLVDEHSEIQAEELRLSTRRMEIETAVAIGLGVLAYDADDVEIHDRRGRWWLPIFRGDEAKIYVQYGNAPCTAHVIASGDVHVFYPPKFESPRFDLRRFESVSVLCYVDDGTHFVIFDNALEVKDPNA